MTVRSKKKTLGVKKKIKKEKRKERDEKTTNKKN